MNIHIKKFSASILKVLKPTFSDVGFFIQNISLHLQFIFLFLGYYY